MATSVAFLSLFRPVCPLSGGRILTHRAGLSARNDRYAEAAECKDI